MKTLALILALVSLSFIPKEFKKYTVVEVPGNNEGTLWIDKEYCPGDTIKTLSKTFIVIE